jgi:hypothetical protein
MSFMLLGILNSQAAGGEAGSFDLLESETLTSSALNITFDNLDAYSDYQHLQIRVFARGDGNGDLGGVGAVLNNDTGSSYSFHRLQGNGSSVSAGGAAYIPYAVAGTLTMNSATSIYYGVSVIDILDFSSNNKATTLRTLSGAHVAQNSCAIKLESAAWFNTNSVTSVQLITTNASNFVAGSRFVLIGVK